MNSTLTALQEELAPEVSPIADGNTATWPPVAAPAPVATLAEGANQPLSKEVTRHLVGGTSALGISVAVERGVGLLANILAARLGG